MALPLADADLRSHVVPYDKGIITPGECPKPGFLIRGALATWIFSRRAKRWFPLKRRRLFPYANSAKKPPTIQFPLQPEVESLFGREKIESKCCAVVEICSRFAETEALASVKERLQLLRSIAIEETGLRGLARRNNSGSHTIPLTSSYMISVVVLAAEVDADSAGYEQRK